MPFAGALRRLFTFVFVALAIPLPTVASTAAVVDGGLTARLRSSIDLRRAASGLDPLFARGTYVTQASAMARTLADGGSVRTPADGTPAAWVVRDLPTATLDLAVDEAVVTVTRALSVALGYSLHTDGGWAVTTSVAGLTTRIGVVLLVGWPDPVVGADRGCGAGYCWEARGVNPHLPWTRNRLPVYLSSAGAPAAAESLLRAAIARINTVAGLGTDVVYGGATPASSPAAGHQFLVQWSTSSTCGTGALACTVTSTHGSPKLIYGARIIALAGRYAASPIAENWIGTLTHELGHALGLGHYDAPYAGALQLMRSASGSHSPRSGDVAGLRTLDRLGAISTRLVSTSSGFGTGTTARMTVTTSSSGFGGIRSVAIECVDRHGRITAAVRRTGVWDIRGLSHAFAWTVGVGPPYATTCRSVVTSKGSRAYSPWIALSFAG